MSKQPHICKGHGPLRVDQEEVVPQFPLARLALPAIHDTSSSFWSRYWLPESPFTAGDAVSNNNGIISTAANPNTSGVIATS
jgi:hypothetical protein